MIHDHSQGKKWCKYINVDLLIIFYVFSLFYILIVFNNEEENRFSNPNTNIKRLQDPPTNDVDAGG